MIDNSNFGFKIKEWDREEREGSHSEKRLDKVYICCQCMAVFLFRSDVQEHFVNSGHKEVVIVIDILALDAKGKREGRTGIRNKDKDNKEDAFFSKN